MLIYGYYALVRAVIYEFVGFKVQVVLRGERVTRYCIPLTVKCGRCVASFDQ